MAGQIFNRTVNVEGIDIFYRVCGQKENPSLLLLHGFPTSSAMFKSLMVALSDAYYLVAPDYPGFGFSDFPPMEEYDYTFENIADTMYKFTEAIQLKSFSIYLHDYGSPVGLRICVAHPGKIERIIVQCGNGYEEGLGPQWDEVKDYWKNPTDEKKKKIYWFLSEAGTKWQYTAGLPDDRLDRISPETWITDWDRLKRPGNLAMQYKLNVDFKTNVDMFPAFQEFFRIHQPPALIIWGRYEVFFSIEEAYCYQHDIPDAQVHIVEGGHMLLESNFDEVAGLIRDFMESA